jgi:hypothetical protein
MRNLSLLVMLFWIYVRVFSLSGDMSTKSLTLVVVQHVFKAHPEYTEGALTMLKVCISTWFEDIFSLIISCTQSTMTSAGPSAAICAHMGLNRHIHNLPPQMAHAVSTYVAKVEKARGTEYKLAEQEHRRPGLYWADLQAPKVRFSL